MAAGRRDEIGRRSFLSWVGTLAAVPFLGGATQAVAQAAAKAAAPREPPAAEAIERRKLGSIGGMKSPIWSVPSESSRVMVYG